MGGVESAKKKCEKCDGTGKESTGICTHCKQPQRDHNEAMAFRRSPKREGVLSFAKNTTLEVFRSRTLGTEDHEIHVTVICNGLDNINATNCDNVGTTPAAMIATSVCLKLQPSIVLNVGTAGGWNERGAEIAKIYIPNRIQNHDRRIPLDTIDAQRWRQYGVGALDVPIGAKLLLHLKENRPQSARGGWSVYQWE